jgi:MinD superfamily P-loop ATPase
MEGDEYSESICGCCTCCCVYLGGVLRFGVSLPIVTSDKISDFDSTLCNGCGVCVDRCQFDAREIVDGKLVYHMERCFGCSNCTTTCPNQANTMIPRSK